MVELVFVLILTIIAMFTGSFLERRHFKSIREREEKYGDILVISSKHVPDLPTTPKVTLVRGSAVISVDYFKRLLANLRMMFGGRLGAYETLIDRSRREAILRMKEEADMLGADMIFNVRIETSSVFKGKGGNPGSIEVLAYGTALVTKRRKARATAQAA
ncbi:MAG: heavy metal-binding domain-containing protein [Pseudomonadota bacterium]